MNYIKQINAFYDWLETNRLSQSEIVLWHALMHINNKSGWKAQFAVAISVLETKTGLTRRTIERARNKLSQAGLIEWKSRKGNKPALYTLKCLYGNFDAQSVAQPVAQDVVQSVAQPVAINKLNKTKRNKDTVANAREENPFQFYQENFGVLSPLIAETITQWINDLGEELVIEAMKRALFATKNFNYAVGIMKDWYRRNIKTIEDVEAADRNFQRRKRSNQKTVNGGDQYDNLW